MATFVINGFKFNYVGARSFGSVNLLRNFIDITCAMLVTVCVVNTRIVAI